MGAAEAGADLEGLCGGDAEHGVGEDGFQFVEAGLAESGGAVADHAGYGAADAVLTVAEVGDELFHALGGFVVRAAYGQERVDVLAGDSVDQTEELGVGRAGWMGGSGREEVFVADGRGPGDNLNAVGLAKVLFGDCACCDTA